MYPYSAQRSARESFDRSTWTVQTETVKWPIHQCNMIVTEYFLNMYTDTWRNFSQSRVSLDHHQKVRSLSGRARKKRAVNARVKNARGCKRMLPWNSEYFHTVFGVSLVGVIKRGIFLIWKLISVDDEQSKVIGEAKTASEGMTTGTTKQLPKQTEITKLSVSCQLSDYLKWSAIRLSCLEGVSRKSRHTFKPNFEHKNSRAAKTTILIHKIYKIW